MNHLKKITAENFERLKHELSKDILQEYYDNHSWIETKKYFKDTYRCSYGNLDKLFIYFNIERKGKGYVPPERAEKIRQTCLEKYGVENPHQLESVKEKAKQTCIEKYGVENAAQSTQAKESYKQRMQNKYGCDNAFQATEVKEKIKQTVQEKYGVEYVTQAGWFKTSSENIKLQRYGNPHYHNLEKMQQTNLERYGVPMFINKEKAKQTCLKKYGVEYYTQTRECHQKIAASRKRCQAKDGTYLDSNWEVLVYNYALDKGYSILRNDSEFTYWLNGKMHKTLIDFTINGKLYEVKGTYMLNGVLDHSGPPIVAKINIYKANNVSIITDLTKLKYKDPELAYIDINNLNF